MKIHTLPQGTIHEGDWLQADLAPGYTLAILDGPYGIGKAGWDKMGVEGLADWYRPGLKRLDPVIRALGWTWRADITWHKIGANPALISAKTSGKWPDITEVCGHYQRGDAGHTNPEGLGNVWALSPTADLGPERLLSGTLSHRTFGAPVCADPLHPCQKPLLFAERMIRASSRPGDRVLVPFGGTCREAVAIEWMARAEPEQARRYDVCELNQDGPDYIGAALAQIRGEDPRAKAAGQLGLFLNRMVE